MSHARDRAALKQALIELSLTKNTSFLDEAREMFKRADQFLAKKKSDRIKQARRDAKAAGEQVGRARQYNHDTIRKMWSSGYYKTQRALAKELKCTPGFISSVINNGDLPVKR